MPYSDPAKKKAYQDAYNRQYYRRNKTRKNLVNKAVSSKQRLRDQKRQYLWDYFESCCSRCSFDDPSDLVIVPKDPSRRAVWTSRSSSGDTPRYILDYSWESLNGIIPNLELLCNRCRSPATSTEDLKSKISKLSGFNPEDSEDLPKGYVLDDDLEAKV